MKRKLLLIFLAIILLVGITGCGKKEKTKTKKNNTKEMVLLDKTFGYKTTFTYDSKESYTDFEEDKESGKSTEFSLKNKDLNLEFEMYYTSMSSTSYKTTQETRKNQKYYKEYKLGKYDAYAYSNYNDDLYFNIAIETDDKDFVQILFVSIETIGDDDSLVILDVVDKNVIDQFLNNIKIENIK